MESISTGVALLFCLVGTPAVIGRSLVHGQAAQNPASNASTIAQNATPMPSDPAAILSLAAGTNGLDGPDVQPWHIKVSYQTFDSDGDAENSGTYEESWVSPRKYKRSYTSAHFTQTAFATDGGLYRSGNQDWPGPAETNVRALLIQPFAGQINQQESKLDKSDRSFGQVTLQCIAIKPQKTNITVRVIGYPETFPHFCFEQKEPILRFDSQGGGQNDTTYNNIIRFQGRYLARDVKVKNVGKLRLSLHVETIENLSTVTDFTAASDAVGPLSGKITLLPRNMTRLIIKRTPPLYPSSARQARIQGTVVVQAVIGRDGKVAEVHAVSGPPQLQQAAIDCVRKWEFRPFFIMGEPVEVESKFEVLFLLAG
jgi:TonB family protein